MKHKKSECVEFQEGSLPCEDCDLEGHSIICKWHRDWHACDCGKLYEKNFSYSIEISEIIEQPDGSALVQFDLGEDFISWFCQLKQIEKFDKEIFQDWFVEVLSDSVSRYGSASKR